MHQGAAGIPERNLEAHELRAKQFKLKMIAS